MAFSLSDRLRACLPCCTSSSSLTPSSSNENLRTRLLEDADDAMSLHSTFPTRSSLPTTPNKWTGWISLIAGKRAVSREEEEEERPVIVVEQPSASMPTLPPADDAALQEEEALLAAQEEAEVRKARRRARRRARELGLDLAGYGDDAASATTYDGEELVVAAPELKRSKGSSASGSSGGRSRRSRRSRYDDAHSPLPSATSATSHSFSFSPRLTGVDEGSQTGEELIYYPQLALGLDGQPLLDDITGEPLFLLDDAGQPIYAPYPPPVSFLLPNDEPAANEEAPVEEVKQTTAEFLAALAKKKRAPTKPVAVEKEVRVVDARADSSDEELSNALAGLADGASRRMRWEGTEDGAMHLRRTEEEEEDDE